VEKESKGSDRRRDGLMISCINFGLAIGIVLLGCFFDFRFTSRYNVFYILPI
jgi:hypothetical protein